MRPPLSAGLARIAPRRRWMTFWLRRSGLSPAGRVAGRLAALFAPPYKDAMELARLTPRGYISPTAIVRHPRVRLGEHVFIGDQVVIYHKEEGAGAVDLGDRVHLHRDIIIEIGAGGSLRIDADTYIQARCYFSSVWAPIRIGAGVMIAPYCAFYSYDHGFAPGAPIRLQPVRSRGGIVIEDESWLGVGVIVLDGVRIGRGAVVGAGAVVTEDIPDDAIAVGVPARVVRMRGEMPVSTMASSWPKLRPSGSSACSAESAGVETGTDE